MRFNTVINNVKAQEWGMNIQLAYLFAWIYELPSWADKMIVGSTVYYFASKNKAVEELPLLTDKVDTMYRYYKQLEDMQLIETKKVDNKDYIAITEKGKDWNYSTFEHSENFPKVVGNKSESDSETNPTDNNTNSNNNITHKDGDLFQDVDVKTLPEQVLIYLNKQLKQFNKLSKGFGITDSNMTEIKTRIKEKYRLEDFKKVIDAKIIDWGNDQERRKFLRPETLFGKKFNGYLLSADDLIANAPVGSGSDNFENVIATEEQLK